MSERRKRSSDSRVDTNVSLAAERESLNTKNDAALVAQLTMDDLLERDRILADEHPLQSRAHADTRIDLQRAASPTRDKAMINERSALDQEKLADREMSDRVLKQERDSANTRSVAVSASPMPMHNNRSSRVHP